MYSIFIVNKLLQHKVILISKTWMHQHNFFTIAFYYIITNVNYQVLMFTTMLQLPVLYFS